LALKKEKAESEAYDHQARLAPILPHDEYYENPYLVLILDRWKLIAAVTSVAIVVTYILTKFVMTPWYQATAIIEPIPESAVENRVEGGLGGFAGGGMSSFLMATGTDSQAQEYLTILRSFTFNTNVALQHNLTNDLLPADAEKPKTERKLKMKLFDILKGRFKVEYSIQGHNLSVHFIDRDPIRAQEILQYYLDDLRELQRQEAIRNASAAISSLEKEATTTGDSLLRENLYALVARQLQQQKLAEVEADFAFKILEYPVSPDKPYSPRASLNCLLVLILIPMLMAAGILLKQTWRDEGGRRPATHLRRRTATDHDASF
jgi:LPS O-antigen subunit length determinant protein (WzzB/FepE family)